MLNENEDTEEEANGERITDETRTGEHLQLKDWLILFSSPEDYYSKKTGEDSPPPSLKTFLDDNSKMLTIVGVFGALFVYFVQLIPTPSRTLLFGMTGGALMLSVVLMVVLHNAFIALIQAGALRSTVYAVYVVPYTIVFISLLSITFGMIAFFAQFPSVFLELADIIVGILVVIVAVWVLWASFGVSVPIQCSEQAKYFIRGSGIIGMMIFTSGFLVFKGVKLIIKPDITISIPIWSEYMISAIKHNDFSLLVIGGIFLIFLISAAVALTVVIAHGIVVSKARLWNLIRR
jgi:hypothetical protein